MMTRRAASIGIIGGADGPTAIFVVSSQGPGFWLAAALVTAVLAGLAFYLIKRARRRGNRKE